MMIVPAALDVLDALRVLDAHRGHHELAEHSVLA